MALPGMDLAFVALDMAYLFDHAGVKRILGIQKLDAEFEAVVARTALCDSCLGLERWPDEFYA